MSELKTCTLDEVLANVEAQLKAAGLPSYKHVMDSLVDLDELQFFDPVQADPDEQTESLKLGLRVAVNQYGTGDLGDLDYEGVENSPPVYPRAK